tara:strand:+ start:627 stop:1499 length:873 start_codon:yes stop_codon:yes gene_type:complete
MKILNKIKNLLLFNILYKVLDPIYVFLDKMHIRRSKNMQMIPSALFRRGGAYSYAEWSYIIGVIHTIIENNLKDKTNLQILDIGCGAGLVLNAVNQFIGKNGSYTGIDVMKSEIDFCKKHYPKKFKFFHIETKNNYYSPKQEKNIAWKFFDNSFDVITAISVWTHLNEIDARFYINEVSRVLKINGKAFITFFSLDEDYENFLKKDLNLKSNFHNQTRLQYVYNKKAYDSDNWFYPSWTKVPERAIAVNYNALKDMFDKSNLRITKHYKGTWKEVPGVFFQDIFVLQKIL